MRKKIRITERDLCNIVRNAINESDRYKLTQVNGKYNFLGPDGSLASDTKWYDNSELGGRFTRVKKNGRFNYIDRDGYKLSPDYDFDDASDFRDGKSRVRRNGRNYTLHDDGRFEPFSDGDLNEAIRRAIRRYLR